MREAICSNQLDVFYICDLGPHFSGKVKVMGQGHGSRSWVKVMGQGHGLRSWCHGTWQSYAGVHYFFNIGSRCEY